MAISNYINENFDLFKDLLDLEKAPSHDCLNDLVNSLDSNLLELAFEQWVQSYYKPNGLHQISGDGTFVCASTDKIREGKEPNIVNFLSAETNLVLASELAMGKGRRETELLNAFCFACF